MSKRIKDLEVLVTAAIKYKTENRDMLISDLKRAKSKKKLKEKKD